MPAGRAAHTKPLAAAVYSCCRRDEYAIAYGVLRDVKDEALARSEGKLVRLRKVRISASLRVDGMVAYAVLPSEPSEILLRWPSGQTVLVRKLGWGVSEARETCDGEAEPGG